MADNINKKSVYLTLCFFDSSKSRKLEFPSKDKATIDAHGEYVLLHIPFAHYIICNDAKGVYTYLAWASALLDLDGMGNARRLEEWDEQQVQHPRFFHVNNLRAYLGAL